MIPERGVRIKVRRLEVRVGGGERGRAGSLSDCSEVKGGKRGPTVWAYPNLKPANHEHAG